MNLVNGRTPEPPSRSVQFTKYLCRRSSIVCIRSPASWAHRVRFSAPSRERGGTRKVEINRSTGRARERGAFWQNRLTDGWTKVGRQRRILKTATNFSQVRPL